MSDSLETSPVDFDAEDAALRDHRREANKATRWFLLAAALFGLMFIVLIGAFAISMNRGKTPATQPIAAVTPQAVATVDKDAEIASLRNQILALQAQAGQGTTTTAPAFAADPAALAQLSARLDRVEANQRALARAASAANAAADLQQASRGEAPFLSQLAVVEASADDPAAVALLRPYAEKGVPSEVSLAIEFPRYAAAANVAARQASDRGGLISQVLHAFDVISIRRTDSLGGASPDAILHQAELQLDAGDLRGAVAGLARLPLKAQTSLKPWMDQAQARLSVDDATQRLTEGALSRLSQTGDYATVTAAGGAL